MRVIFTVTSRHTEVSELALGATWPNGQIFAETFSSAGLGLARSAGRLAVAVLLFLPDVAFQNLHLLEAAIHALHFLRSSACQALTSKQARMERTLKRQSFAGSVLQTLLNRPERPLTNKWNSPRNSPKAVTTANRVRWPSRKSDEAK